MQPTQNDHDNACTDNNTNHSCGFLSLRCCFPVRDSRVAGVMQPKSCSRRQDEELRLFLLCEEFLFQIQSGSRCLRTGIAMLKINQVRTKKKNQETKESSGRANSNIFKPPKG